MIDNSMSNRYTVLQVTGLDRLRAVVSELTTALSKLNLKYWIGSYRYFRRESRRLILRD